MKMVPIVFTWQLVDVTDEHGEVHRVRAMVPTKRYERVAGKQFFEREEYPLAVVEARSRASHNGYFAEIGEVFDNLPHDLAALGEALNLKFPIEGFVDAEHLRKWALCETGWCEKTEFDFDSKGDAVKVAKLYRSRDSYCQISVRGAHVTIKEALSQSAAAMSKEPFEKSKKDVLDLLSSIIDVKRSDLRKNAGRSA